MDINISLSGICAPFLLQPILFLSEYLSPSLLNSSHPQYPFQHSLFLLLSLALSRSHLPLLNTHCPPCMINADRCTRSVFKIIPSSLVKATAVSQQSDF